MKKTTTKLSILFNNYNPTPNTSKPYLPEHAQYHPRGTIESFIWDSYFTQAKEKDK